ncbi:MAG: response regulator transcription factor [Cellulosilyticaceae bacterium]
MKPYKILVVEDDNDINQLLTALLEQEGYKVQSAYSGTEGLLYVKQETWDLILLDLMLPGKAGEDVLIEMRKVYQMPILIISAKEETGIKVELLRAGADDFITKPFDIQEVLARVEANIRRYRQGQDSLRGLGNQLCYQEITLDKEHHSVRVGESPVVLTAREFAILEQLMRYPKKVFSKSNLYESVWGADYLGEDNTLNVHISNIRGKLAKGGAKQEYIQTVWGIGYKLET